MHKASLTIESSDSILSLAREIHGLLTEHGNPAEAIAAAKVGVVLFEAMPYRDEHERIRESMGITKELIEQFLAKTQQSRATESEKAG